MSLQLALFVVAHSSSRPFATQVRGHTELRRTCGDATKINWQCGESTDGRSEECLTAPQQLCGARNRVQSRTEPSIPPPPDNGRFSTCLLGSRRGSVGSCANGPLPPCRSAAPERSASLMTEQRMSAALAMRGDGLTLNESAALLSVETLLRRACSGCDRCKRRRRGRAYELGSGRSVGRGSGGTLDAWLLLAGAVVAAIFTFLGTRLGQLTRPRRRNNSISAKPASICKRRSIRLLSGPPAKTKTCRNWNSNPAVAGE